MSLTEKAHKRRCGNTRVQAHKTMKNLFRNLLPLAIALAGASSNFAADDLTQDSVYGAAKRSGPSELKQADESRLSSASAKVVRLLQAGIDEKVIVAFAKNNPAPKALSADELIYLHELGVSSSVLTAMLTPSKKTETAQTSVPAATDEKVEVTSNYIPIPGAPQPPQVNGSAVISSPAPAPVVITQPAQPTFVYTQPAPVIIETPPPVYYEPRPTFSFGFGLGHFGHFGHGGHHSIFRHGHPGGHFGGHGGHHGGHRGGHH